MASTGANAVAGEIIGERYRIERWLGQGNMGIVFHATHLGTGQACALKLVHKHLVEEDDNEIQVKFVQEARVGQRIGPNPYIVNVFDAGIDAESGVPFLAMNLLEGVTLDQCIKQRGPMPPRLLKALLLQLADALKQAHEAGVVHRDLKPGNLVLTTNRKGHPQLCVVDFGIAKLMEESAQQTATPIGTPAYAAPEQNGNALREMAKRMGYEVASTISPATDIWAMGVITYELLVGAPPGHLWARDKRLNSKDLKEVIATQPTPSARARAGERASLLPPGFDTWLERCLQKNAANRWPSAEMAVQRFLELFGDVRYEMDGARIPYAIKSLTAHERAYLQIQNRSEPMQSLVNRSRHRAVADHLGRRHPGSDMTKPDEATEIVPEDAAVRIANNPSTVAIRDRLPLSLPMNAARRRNRGNGARVIGATVAISAMALAIGGVLVANRAQIANGPKVRPSNDHSNQAQSSFFVSTSAERSSEPFCVPKSPEHVPQSMEVPTDGRALLTIESTPGSCIVLNGNIIGIAPQLGLSLKPGEYRIAAVRREIPVPPQIGYKEMVVLLKAGETIKVPVKID